jgi:hypothetical protein
MSNSLRDQLLKSGLVSKEQAKTADKQAKSKLHQQQKQKRKKKKKAAQKEEIDTESATYLAAKAHEAEKQRAQELNRQRELEREQKEIQAQVRDLIQSYYIIDHKADISYHFLEGKFVRKIYVNATQQQQLNNGQLAIVSLDDSYYLVPISVADKILERLPETVLFYPHQDEPKIEEIDDPYADYPIPDDLMW